MTDEVRKLIIETGISLHLKDEQITLLDLAINIAYNAGYLDAKKDKTDIEIALEQGASLDDLPCKQL